MTKEGAVSGAVLTIEARHTVEKKGQSAGLDGGSNTHSMCWNNSKFDTEVRLV